MMGVSKKAKPIGLIEARLFVMKWGGIGRLSFFLLGMRMNKSNAVRCPETGMCGLRSDFENVYAAYVKDIQSRDKNND